MEFDLYTIVILMIAFWWSGFVRAGIGFGGAGLMYPVALLAVDSILFLVPIICVQLLIFSTATLIKDHHLIDWKTLGKLFGILFQCIRKGGATLHLLFDAFQHAFERGVLLLCVQDIQG